MNVSISDLQNVTDVECTLFSFVQQGPVPAGILLENKGVNIISFKIQEFNGTDWITLYSDAITSGSGRIYNVNSNYPMLRCVGYASGGSKLLFSSSRFVDRPSKGNIPILTVNPGSGAISDDPAPINYFFAELVQVGTLTLNQSFGVFEAPQNVYCHGVQLPITVPTAGLINTQVDLVTYPGGVAQNKVSELLPSSLYNQTMFQLPLAMPRGSQWQAKIIQVNTTPGSGLTARLILSYA